MALNQGYFSPFWPLEESGLHLPEGIRKAALNSGCHAWVPTSAPSSVLISTLHGLSAVSSTHL